MTESAVTALPTKTLREVARLMADAEVHRVVIVDAHDSPVGIVTCLDLVRSMAA